VGSSLYYLDERGRYQQCQPQPVTIVVREVSGDAGERAHSFPLGKAKGTLTFS